MKICKLAIPVILCLSVSACETVLYSPNAARPLARFSADMDEMIYEGGGVKCHIIQHRPSQTIIAGGNATTKVIGGVGAAAATLMVH